MGYDLSSLQTVSPNPPTQDAYSDVPFGGPEGDQEVLIMPTSGTLSANWKNTHGANAIASRVLGTNDSRALQPSQTLPADADWDVVVAEAVIAAGAMRHVTINPTVYVAYKFQHKANVAAAQGSSFITAANKRI